MNEKTIRAGYAYAKEVFAEQGKDVDAILEKIDAIPVSMHCWQGDDVIGFDGSDSLGGGIATTGNYPGRARTPEELRADLDFALSLIPGTKKLNLHASYAEKNGKSLDRDAYTIEEFQNWTDWAKGHEMGLDFNPTYFSHPMMEGDFSLTAADETKRNFWIEHGKRCLEIAEQFAEQLGKPCVVNYWMPDGMKDTPADTRYYRERMEDALNQILTVPVDNKKVLPALESKVFGIGVESYTVASHEFSFGYAAAHQILYCLDSGHFHPTELISDKLSAVLMRVPGVLLHLTRGIRWDSDHVTGLNDETQRVLDEILWNDYTDRVYIGLDYFDASINRIACWAIGMRNARKGLLAAELAPYETLRKLEKEGDYTGRLALMEGRRTLPMGAVWDYYCMTKVIPAGEDWLAQVRDYENRVLLART